MLSRIYLIPIGLVVGAYGTLVGAGGGFILVPILLFLYLDLEPSVVASISLAVVSLNSASGTVAYFRQRRIDLRAAIWLALAGLPSAVLGAFSTRLLSREQYDVVIGVVLTGIGTLLFAFPKARIHHDPTTSGGQWNRTFVDANGVTYSYSFNRWFGAGVSAAVTYLPSLIGIGGGSIHVPALTTVLGIPPHVATAMSQFVLSVTALAATSVHVASGHGYVGVRRAAMLGIGVIAGAQIGARLSGRCRARC